MSLIRASVGLPPPTLLIINAQSRSVSLIEIISIGVEEEELEFMTEILRSVGFLGVKPFLLGAPIALSNLSSNEFRRRRQRLALSEEVEISRK